MFLLIATAAIGVLDIILFWLVCLNAAHEFKTRYPELKIKKSHWSKSALAAIQLGVAVLIPLFNILLAYVLIFKSDEIIQKGVHKIYMKCMNEAENA